MPAYARRQIVDEAVVGVLALRRPLRATRVSLWRGPL